MPIFGVKDVVRKYIKGNYVAKARKLDFCLTIGAYPFAYWRTLINVIRNIRILSYSFGAPGNACVKMMLWTSYTFDTII